MTQVVNGEEIIFNCRVIIPYFLLSVMSIPSFLFDTHLNIILHASCLLRFKPSQLRIVMIIALKQWKPAAVVHTSAMRIIPYLTNASKNLWLWDMCPHDTPPTGPVLSE